jgi:hypothetical protein
MAFYPLSSARADFFDDARQTFQKDIPHFSKMISLAHSVLQTSHTRTSCKLRENSGRQELGGNTGSAPATREGSRQSQEPQAYDQ